MLSEVEDIESDGNGAIVAAAVKDYGLQTVVTFHGGNPRTCRWTPAVREAVI